MMPASQKVVYGSITCNEMAQTTLLGKKLGLEMDPFFSEAFYQGHFRVLRDVFH